MNRARHRWWLLALMVVAALMFSGCASLTGLGAARTLDKGEEELGVGLDASIVAPKLSPAAAPWIPYAQLSSRYRRGMGPVELGTRIWALGFPGLFGLGISGEVRVPLLEAPNIEKGVDITLGTSLGYHQFNFGKVPNHVPFIDVPLMFGFNMIGGHQFVVSARVRDEILTGPGVSPVNIFYGGGTVGAHIIVNEKWAFQPELAILYSPVSFNGLVRDPERTGLTMVQFGIGGAFDL